MTKLKYFVQTTSLMALGAFPVNLFAAVIISQQVCLLLL